MQEPLDSQPHLLDPHPRRLPLLDLPARARATSIFTGTPDGVGMARGRFLAPGDVVTRGRRASASCATRCVAGTGRCQPMSLHRLLGLHAAVPDPAALAAFYAELGLVGDAASGFTGTDGGASVTLSEGPFRRLDSVERRLPWTSPTWRPSPARLGDGGADAR